MCVCACTGQVSTFLEKAQRQIASKVANEELTRVTRSFSEQLQESRNVLQAQMDVVRNRVERSTEDFERVVQTSTPPPRAPQTA